MANLGVPAESVFLKVVSPQSPGKWEEWIPGPTQDLWAQTPSLGPRKQSLNIRSRKFWWARHLRTTGPPNNYLLILRLQVQKNSLLLCDTQFSIAQNPASGIISALRFNPPTFQVVLFQVQRFRQVWHILLLTKHEDAVSLSPVTSWELCLWLSIFEHLWKLNMFPTRLKLGQCFLYMLIFFFFFCLAAACRVPGPGMEPMSQLWPEPLQGQCLILDPLCHRRTPTLCIFNLVQILPTQCSFLFTLRTRHQSFLLFLFASFKVTDSALFQHYAVVAPPVQKLSREPLTSTDEVSRMCLFLCCFGQFSGES